MSADRTRSAYDKIMTVVVGPDGDEKEFQLHRGLLCFYSEYFDRMLNGGFKEAGSNSLRLKEVDALIFERFYYWMYSGVVDCDFKTAGSPDSWSSAVQLYLFADYHNAPGLQNAALDYIWFKMKEFDRIPLLSTPLLYSNTTELDPLRKLLVDIAVGSWRADDVVKHHELYAPEFLANYIAGLKDREWVPEAGVDIEARDEDVRRHFCELYHVHPQTSPKKITALGS